MIKLAEIPEYLLYAESELESFQGQSLGRWRFILQSIQNTVRFDATDWEPSVSLERLELLTVIRGLEELDQPSSVTIVTESNYVAHGFGFGLREWRHNGWQWERFGDLVPITNDDLWRRLDRASQVHQLQCRRGKWSDAAPETAIERSPPKNLSTRESPPTPWRRDNPARRWIRNLSRIASSIIPI